MSLCWSVIIFIVIYDMTGSVTEIEDIFSRTAPPDLNLQLGGLYVPKSSSNSLSSISTLTIRRNAIIIPYRNRLEDLKTLLPYLHKYLQTGINSSSLIYKIFIIEQSDYKNLQFNRAFLLNVGFLIAEEELFDCYTFHDVDMLPLGACDYTCPRKFSKKFRHLAGQLSRDNFEVKNYTYFGGVYLMTEFQYKVFGVFI